MIKRNFQLALAACLALGMSSVANAQIFTGASSSSWADTANWDTGSLPGSGDNVQIGTETNTGVTADFDLASATINDLRVGNGADLGGATGATGTFNMNSGTLALNGWAFAGVDGAAASTGTINLGGDAAFSSGQFHLGLGGGTGAVSTGILNLSGTASLNTADVRIGSNDANVGMATITGGSLISSTQMVVGTNTSGGGSVNQSAGVVSTNDWATVGEGGGVTATYDLSGGSLTAGTDLTIGQADAGTVGNFNLSGTGSATVNVGLFVGRGQFGGGGATGNLNIDGSDATFQAFGDVHFGGFDFAAADAVGNLNFTADAGGVSTLDISGSLFLNDGTGVGASNLNVDLTSDADFALFAW